MFESSPETVQYVGVMSVEVSRQRTPQLLGELHRGLGGVVHAGPGREHGPRHQDHSLEVGLADHRTVDKVLHTCSPHTLKYLNFNSSFTIFLTVIRCNLQFSHNETFLVFPYIGFHISHTSIH